jgi:hypothetical protein
MSLFNIWDDLKPLSTSSRLYNDKDERFIDEQKHINKNLSGFFNFNDENK